eukprot:c21454_g1_i1 orf=283-915(+)
MSLSRFFKVDTRALSVSLSLCLPAFFLSVGNTNRPEQGLRAETRMRNSQSFLGMIEARVIRGKNLAVRDIFSSDPYVKLSIGDQEVKTTVSSSNLNPEWNEVLRLYVSNLQQLLKLQVLDKDYLSADDKMGDAIIDLRPLLRVAKLHDGKFFDRSSKSQKLVATKENGMLKDSTIRLKNGSIVQDICVKLKNVEKGQIELELKWCPQGAC